MSRFVFALVSTTLLAGLVCAPASKARAAAAVCDLAACINTKCKGAVARAIQLCNTNCQIEIAENKKKLCK